MIVLVTVEVKDGAPRVTRVAYQPTWVQPRTYRVLPVARALDDPATSDAERVDLRRSWQHTVGAISALGADTQGVVPDEVPHAAP